jgi:hypothetical protein
MPSDFLENFIDIKQKLTLANTCINIYDYAFEKNISIKSSQIILNEYIESCKNSDLEDFIIIFRAEIYEDNKILMKYFPSYSVELNNILNANSKNTLKDFGVYSIIRKFKDFELNNYNIISHELRNLKIIDSALFPKVKKINIDKTNNDDNAMLIDSKNHKGKDNTISNKFNLIK